MLCHSSRGISLLAVTLIVGAWPSVLRAEEATRDFANYHCKYTLPGKDWRWDNVNEPNIIMVAINSRGFAVTLSYAPLPRTVPIDKAFVNAFEQGFYGDGEFKKRGGRHVAFQGLPAYRAEAVVADGRSFVTLVFLGHGMSYHLGILGSKEPIENDPDYEKIINGFAFTKPPTAPAEDPPAEDGRGGVLEVSAWMGRIAAVCLIGAILLAVVFRLARRKTP